MDAGPLARPDRRLRARSGPIAEVLPFFSSLGFDCPPRKDPGSFLQEVTTPVGQLAYATPALLEQRHIPERLRDPMALLSKPPTDLLLTLEAISGKLACASAWGVAAVTHSGRRAVPCSACSACVCAC